MSYVCFLHLLLVFLCVFKKIIRSSSWFFVFKSMYQVLVFFLVFKKIYQCFVLAFLCVLKKYQVFVLFFVFKKYIRSSSWFFAFKNICQVLVGLTSAANILILHPLYAGRCYSHL